MSYEPDDDVKAKKNVTLTTEVIPFYLEKFDAIAQENDGHLALGRVSLRCLTILQCCLFVYWPHRVLSQFRPHKNEQLTWADVYFAGILDYLNYMTRTDLVEKYPNLKRIVETVTSLEQIKTWLEKRPQTDV